MEKPRFSPALWPFDADRRRRLEAFQASPEHAPAETSVFWDAHAPATGVEPTETTATVYAGFSFGSPTDRAPLPVIAPARLLWRLHAAGLAERRQTEATSRKARRIYQPATISRDLHEIPAYQRLAGTRPGAPIPLYRYATHLNTIAPAASHARTLLEIGGGAGLVAHGAQRLLDLEQVTLVDLPEMLEVAFVVLTHYGHDVALPNEPGGARVRLLTPAQTDEIEDGSVDVIVNTSSFQEMTYPMIGSYFDLIERAAAPGAIFYSSNEAVGLRVTPEPPAFDRYPWRPDWRTIIDGPEPFVTALTGAPMRERLVEVKPQGGNDHEG